MYKAKIFIKNKLGAFDPRHHQGELKKVIMVTKHKKARRSISLWGNRHIEHFCAFY